MFSRQSMNLLADHVLFSNRSNGPVLELDING